MDRKQIEKLFTLFTHDNDTEKWSDIIDDAIFFTELALREDADETDVRLAYYAAAYANVKYNEIWANQTITSPTFAGNEEIIKDCLAHVRNAKNMELEYFKECCELFDDSSFYFLCV